MALLKEEKQAILSHFKQSENDTGSSEVQVALLTFRMKGLTHHFQKNPKDEHSRRGLLKIVSQRRRILDDLKRKSFSRYTDLIQSLELRK